MLIALLVCVSCVAQFETSTPTPKSELREYLRTTGAVVAKERHAIAIQQAESKLNAGKKATINKSVGKPVMHWISGKGLDSVIVGSAAEKSKFIAQASEELQRLKEKDVKYLPPIPPRLPQATMRVGDAGNLTMPVTVIQVISANRMLVESGIDELRRVFIVNMPTAGYTDDTEVSLASLCFEVVGTASYENALGVRRTVLDLQLLDLSEFIEHKPPPK